MRSISNRLTIRAAALLALAAAGFAGAVASAESVYGVTREQFLVTFDSATPDDIQSGVAISGLQQGEAIVGIDVRPATFELYGLGSFSRLYKINPATGVATQIGDPFTEKLNGSSFGFDFNPRVDRVRITSNADQNLRVHPDTGAIVAKDGTLKFNNGDVNFGQEPNIVHSAYNKNFKGTDSTVLYNIDSGLDALVIQDPPNDGGLKTVGLLGTDVTDIGGFDISGKTGVAYAAITAADLSKTTFWTIDLGSGAGSMVGEVGGGSSLTALTVVPEPSSLLCLIAVVAAFSSRRSR